MENVVENGIKNTAPETPDAPVPEKKGMDARKKELIKRWVINLLPIIILGVLFAIYFILLAKNYPDATLLERQFKTLINKFIVIAFVATGAVFIFTLGQFDISLGANTAFSALIGVIAYNATGSLFVLFLVCILVAVGISVLNAALSSIFNLPLFVMTVAMMSVLMALMVTIIRSQIDNGGTGVAVNVLRDLARSDGFKALGEIGIKLVILAIFSLICLFIYEFTKVGRKQKFLGGNPVCAKLTGIKISAMGIIAFAMAGLGAGLGATMEVAYTQSITAGSAGGVGMGVFIAIVFGGMPISGGARSRIYAALVGGMSYQLLDRILFMLLENVSTGRSGIMQVVCAIVFLGVVFASGWNYRTKNLPR